MIRLTGARIRAPRRGHEPPSEILAGVDLFIRNSEYVALVGPNAAGKTHVLQVLAGLRAIDDGEITFDLSHDSPRVGIVFQSPDDQIVGSTVERDLAFGLENRGLPSEEIRRRVDEALAWSGLAGAARRPPHLLSEGEKQRLALTSSLVLEPDLLLLDEPTSRLDPPGRRLFLEALHRARRERGTAVVHVTHRSEEILPCDRVVGLEAGRVTFDGSPAQLLRDSESDRLGVRWSGLHRFRRALLRRGVDLDDRAGEDWNDVGQTLQALEVA